MPDRPYIIDQIVSVKLIIARIKALVLKITGKFFDTPELVIAGLLRRYFVLIGKVRFIET